MPVSFDICISYIKKIDSAIDKHVDCLFLNQGTDGIPGVEGQRGEKGAKGDSGPIGNIQHKKMLNLK